MLKANYSTVSHAVVISIAAALCSLSNGWRCSTQTAAGAGPGRSQEEKRLIAREVYR